MDDFVEGWPANCQLPLLSAGRPTWAQPPGYVRRTSGGELLDPGVGVVHNVDVPGGVDGNAEGPVELPVALAGPAEVAEVRVRTGRRRDVEVADPVVGRFGDVERGADQCDVPRLTERSTRCGGAEGADQGPCRVEDVHDALLGRGGVDVSGRVDSDTGAAGGSARAEPGPARHGESGDLLARLSEHLEA